MTGKPRSLPKKKLPSYLLHKPTGQARVRINGRGYYLGPFGSDQSRVRYGETIAQTAGGVPIDPLAKTGADDPASVAVLCLAFLDHAKQHYSKNGRTTAEYDCFKSAIRPLRELYGMTPAKDFGPLALKAVRQKMIESGGTRKRPWCRSFINKSIGRIRRIFRHGVENELVEPSVLQKLEAVSPLLAGSLRLL